MTTKIKPLLLSAVIAASAPAFAEDDVVINGFLSAGFGFLDTDEITVGGFDQDLTVKEDTIFGLQLTKAVTEQFSLTAQLVARGNEDYEVDGAWAFAKYQYTPETAFRVGRIRLPLFHYSDFQEVGYAYPWIRPPEEVYRFNFTSVDAIDVNHQFYLGSVQTDVQVYAGHSEENFNGLPLESDNLIGAITKFSIDNWSFRAAIAEASITVETDGTPLGALVALDDSFELDRSKATFYALSASFDNGTNIFLAEWTAIEADSAAFSDDTAWMVMAGHRIDEYTIHLTYTEVDNDLESGMTGVLQQGLELENKENSIIAGVRKEMGPGVAIKFEVQHNDEELIASVEGESGILYSFAVDMVF